MGSRRVRRLVAVGTAAAVVAVGAVAAVAAEGGPPADVVAAAQSAATNARDAARALVVQAQAQQENGETEEASEGDTEGKGTAAFQERHAALAEKHAEKPGNAARVHLALANGESPSGLGQEQAAANKAMKEARKALKAEGEKPGRGLGRDKNATETPEGS